MYVFAFDRDWTVDVNPHPDRDAVPLEWVRTLAHDTEHAVYAIGNQTLAEEAAIPGVVDIVGQHPDPWTDWLGEKSPDGRYERYPTRRERLELIRDLRPDAEGYIVVDDLDLSDVPGWEHYHAWEFVPAVERGDIHPELPWVQDAVGDGGLPASAGIVPVNPSMLAEFLDEHAREAAGFELTYRDGGEEVSRVLHDASMHAVTLERPSAAPAIQCTPLAPTESQFTVAVDAIEQLSVVTPPPELYTTGTETPADEATALRRLAEVHPDQVRIASVLAILEREDEDLFRDRNALQALRYVAAERPADCIQTLPVLRSLLARDELIGRDDLLIILRRIGDHDPGAIAPLADDLRPFLEAANVTVRREATRCLTAIAEEHPEDVVDGVPALATIVDDDADGAEYAVYALSRITTTNPHEVKPVADTLGDIILDETASDGARLNATAGLGRIIGEYPGVGVDLVDDIAALLDAETPKLRNNAIGLIGDVAIVHTDVVEPYTDQIAALLTVDDPYTRINASGALARVAEDFPESVEPVTSTFIQLLTAENPLVRENACWALGHLTAVEAKGALENLARRGDESDVRERAVWALDQLDDNTHGALWIQCPFCTGFPR